LPPPAPNKNITQFRENGKSQEVVKIEKKMGRPTDAPKSYRESFRLSESDMEKIRFCMEKTGASKTDVVRMGIEALYKKLNQ